jgi:short-subunit dehydrogenase
MDNIAGKTIAVTGAARGIGYATAAALLRRGARVVVGDRDVAALQTAVEELAKTGKVSGHPLDVTDRESFATFLDNASVDGGASIDVLINNAGVMPVGPFLGQSEQAIRSAIEVNFYGVLNGCHLALPAMVARRSGHIINIASLAGVVAVPGQVVYAGSKYAVVGLSTAMADEFAPHGVNVTVVMPPFTQTELIAGTKATRASKPVPPEDIAAAIVAVLDTPKTHVSVPSSARAIAALTSTLSPRGRRWLNRRMGTDRLFLDLDVTARRAYEQRAQAAFGVIDNAGAHSSAGESPPAAGRRRNDLGQRRALKDGHHLGQRGREDQDGEQLV